MCDTKTTNLHAQLVSSMGETLGVNMTEALEDGRLSREEWRDAVMACTGCAEPCACGKWLADHAQTGAAEAPDYCSNHDLFPRLRDEKTARIAAE